MDCEMVSTAESPTVLTLDDTHVYFGGGTGIFRATKEPPWEGVPHPTGLVEVEMGGATPVWSLDKVDIALDASSVYFTVALDSSLRRGIYRVPLEGGTPTKLVDEPEAKGQLSGIAVNSSSVYWGAWWDNPSNPGHPLGALRSIALAGGDPAVLDSDSGAFKIIADDTTVFWLRMPFDNQGGVKSIPAKGGPASVVAVGAEMDIATDATHVYWLQEFIEDVDPGEELKCQIKRAPKAGGASSVVAEAPCTGSIAVDSTNVYYAYTGTWTDYPNGYQCDGAIMRVSKSGGTLVKLNPALLPYDIAVDEEYVYWVVDGMGDGNGEVLRWKKQ